MGQTCCVCVLDVMSTPMLSGGDGVRRGGAKNIRVGPFNRSSHGSRRCLNTTTCASSEEQRQDAPASLSSPFTAMSYYFTIIGTRDNPLFELDFGTSKVGGDGIARFREEAKHMNQFIVHAAIDMVEEAQWSTKDLYVPESAACVSQKFDREADTSRRSTPSRTITFTVSSQAATSSSCS